MHCVGEESLTSSEKATAQPLSEPIPISTTNGVITVTHYATICVTSLQIEVFALILQNSPSSLPLGKLIREHEFNFSLVPAHFEGPTLHTPEGYRWPC